MRRVFLSYRRVDTQFITSSIRERLEDPEAFGPGSVFMGLDDIPPRGVPEYERASLPERQHRVPARQ